MNDVPNDTTPEGSDRPDPEITRGKGWTPATDAGSDEGDRRR